MDKKNKSLWKGDNPFGLVSAIPSESLRPVQPCESPAERHSHSSLRKSAPESVEHACNPLVSCLSIGKHELRQFAMQL